LDALLIAYLVPSTVLNVLAGAVQASLIPTYIEVRERDGDEAAGRLVASVLGCSLFASLALTAVLAVSAPWILAVVAPGFDAAALAHARSLFAVFLPLLPLGVVGSVVAALLNAHARLVAPALAPVLTPLLVGLSVFAAGASHGVLAIAVAMTLGTALEALALATVAARVGIRVRVARPTLSPAVRQVARQLSPMIAAAGLMSGTALVDQAMATCLGAGSVAVLGFGSKVVSVALAVASVAISTTMLP